MRVLSMPEVLDLWACASVERSWRRALVLAGADNYDEAAEWPLGQRDERLLALRRQLLGPRMALRQQCASCRADLESAIDLDMLPPPPIGTPAPLEHSGYSVRFRLPDSRMLARIEGAASVEQARAELIDCCVEHAETNGVRVQPRELPPEVIDALGRAIDAADPRANLELSLECAVCAATFTVQFDAASCVWTELDAWARRRLEEVHLLAEAYGWTESEILSLSPRRRQAYIDLVTQ